MDRGTAWRGGTAVTNTAIIERLAKDGLEVRVYPLHDCRLVRWMNETGVILVEQKHRQIAAILRRHRMTATVHPGGVEVPAADAADPSAGAERRAER